jgi:hypothetical protein
MIQGFLFDRIDAKPGASPVGVEHHFPVFDLPDETEPAIPFLHSAIARAQIANDPIAFQLSMPPTSWIWVHAFPPDHRIIRQTR